MGAGFIARSARHFANNVPERNSFLELMPRLHQASWLPTFSEVREIADAAIFSCGVE